MKRYFKKTIALLMAITLVLPGMGPVFAIGEDISLPVTSSETSSSSQSSSSVASSSTESSSSESSSTVSSSSESSDGTSSESSSEESSPEESSSEPMDEGNALKPMDSGPMMMGAAIVTIASADDLAPWFPDAVFRKVVYDSIPAIQNYTGDENQIKDVLAEYKGDIKADHLDIMDAAGLELLRKVGTVDLRYNKITDWSRFSGYDQKYYGEPGKNVTWLIGGNPFKKLPYDGENPQGSSFGGRLILSAVTTEATTYDQFSQPIDITALNDGEYQSISGIGECYDMNNTLIKLSQASILNVPENTTDEGSSKVYDISIQGDNVLNFRASCSTNNTFAISTDPVVNSYAVNEFDTSSLSRTSFKYYIRFGGEIYNKVTLYEDTTEGNVYIAKIDENGNRIDNPATFDIEYKGDDGNWYSTENLETWEKRFRKSHFETSSFSKEVLGGIPPGSYRLKETSTPYGYIFPADPYTYFDVTPKDTDPHLIISGGVSEFIGGKDGTKQTANYNQVFFDSSKTVKLTLANQTIGYQWLIVRYKNSLNEEVKKYFNFQDRLAEAETYINGLLSKGIVTGFSGIEINVSFKEAENMYVDVENTKIPMKTISGTKIWDDENDKYKKRPESIDINLLMKKETDDKWSYFGYPREVKAIDGWKYTFTDCLETDELGNPYQYSVKENRVPYYDTTYGDVVLNNYDITNTFVMPTVSISGNKTWKDSSTDKRPAEITINLLRDGTKIDSATVNAAGSWGYSFANLPYCAEGGANIVYTVEEDPVPGYTTSYKSGGWYNDVLNTLIVSKISVSGTKTWADDNAAAGKRPASVTVNLLRNGTKVDSKTVTGADGWGYTFADMPKTDDNYVPYVYTVTEDPVEAYTTTFQGYNITNTFTIPKVAVSGTKTWDDNHDITKMRPAEITVNLLRDGVKIDNKTTDEANGWQYTFADLPTTGMDGVAYVYSVSEEPIDWYVTSYSGYNITNKWTVPKITVGGTKTWADHENAAGKRPTSIKVNLMRDGVEIDSKTVDAAASWKYSFADLPKTNDMGVLYHYAVVEEPVEGYVTTYQGYDITNTRPIENITVSGQKQWLDSNNAEGDRPSAITVSLLRDGTEIDSKTVSAAENWSYSFVDLPKTDFAETPYKYTLSENPVMGYATSYVGYHIINSKGTQPLSVSGKKTWDDNNDAAKKRPDSITINLLRNQVKVDSKIVGEAEGWSYAFDNLAVQDASNHAYVYTITEEPVPDYSISYFDGANITNTLNTRLLSVDGTKTWVDSSDAAGKRPAEVTVNLLRDGTKIDNKTMDSGSGWKYSFDKLPEKAIDGTRYHYTVAEEPLTDYATTYEGNNIINTLVIPKTSVSGTKTWADNNNKAGSRPVRITVNLLRDGTKVTSKTVDETNAWKYTFADLPANSVDGTPYVYSISEDPVAGYTTSYSGNDITNTWVVPEITVSGTKTWSDSNNAANKRPAEITVNLMRDNVKVDSKTVDEAANWKYSFDKLPERAADGTPYVYKVTEEMVAGYTPTYKGFDITNELVIPKTTISGTKTWADNNDLAKKRPGKIIVNLIRNGTEIASRAIGTADNWEYAFVDLPTVSVDGTHYSYSVTEEPVAGYATSYNGNDIINTWIIPDISVSGVKTWDDNNDRAKVRPAEITINLLRDGAKIDSKTVDAASNWAYTFGNLPSAGTNGVAYVYSITEEPVAGYTTSYSGYNVTNKWIVPNISISGTKTWADHENAAGKRPATVTVNLLRDGVKVDSKATTAADGWSYTFADVPQTNGLGEAYRYSVTEDPIAGYLAAYNGYDITNTRPIENISVSGMKVWLDNKDADGSRPAQITVNLLRDGTKIDSKTVSAADDWKYRFADLPKSDFAEVAYAYTVTEDAVAGYSTIYAGYNIVNGKGTQPININGVKAWDDNNDATKTRPASVTINLLRDKVKVDSKTAKASGNWKYTFSNLPVQDATNHPYTYTITEEPVSGYTISSFDGVNITNALDERLLTIQGTKTWMDNSDAAKKRPAQITVNLLRDGAKIDSKTVDAASNWKYSFDQLPEGAADGTRYDYVVTEEPVTGYATTYAGYNVTNTFVIPTTTISGVKKWVDNCNKAGSRPQQITVNLLRDGIKINSKTVEDTNAWNYSFDNLPTISVDGTPYTYSISEEPVPGYTTTYSGNNIINTRVMPETSVSGTKTWADDENAAKKRPGEITVNLLRDGAKIDSKTVSPADGWKYSFTSLPGGTADAVPYVYSISEEPVDGYTTTYNEYDITNTVVSEDTPKTSVSGTKKWVDNNDAAKSRPTSVTVNLLRDGVKISNQTIGAGNDWRYAFTGLPVSNDNDIRYVYSVTEDAVAGYTASYEGSDIINTLIPVPPAPKPDTPSSGGGGGGGSTNTKPKTKPKKPKEPVEELIPEEIPEPIPEEIYDPEKENPTTGSSRTGLYIALTAATLSGATLAMASRKKKKKAKGV